MITAWTNHLQDPQEKERFTEGLLHSKWLFERLTNLLNQEEQSLDRQELSPRAYDAPNWEYRQAHSNGFRQAIRRIKTLIDLKETDDRKSNG